MINVALKDIQKAQALIGPFIKKTSFTLSSSLSTNKSSNFFFKWENEQKIKSFKIRGALNKILSLDDRKKTQGLIAASAGNHAQGVALASRYAQTKARIVMMETSSQTKIDATIKMGAEVILKGKSYDESYKHAQEIKGDSTFIHAFADPFVIAGQGTVGLEILKDLSDVDSIVMSIGGGGLISGVALAVKSIKPSCKIYGVVWDGTPHHCRSFHQIHEGKFCICKKKFMPDSISQTGLTDGIAVKIPSESIGSFFPKYVDDITCVSEEDIAKALIYLLEKENKVLEGSGVASLAAVLKNERKWDLGKNCCLVISGGNIDKNTFKQIVQKYKYLIE